MVSFEIFVKAMPPSLSELKVLPSFCFAFKIPDDRAVTNIYTTFPIKILLKTRMVFAQNLRSSWLFIVPFVPANCLIVFVVFWLVQCGSQRGPALPMHIVNFPSRCATILCKHTCIVNAYCQLYQQASTNFMQTYLHCYNLEDFFTVSLIKLHAIVMVTLGLAHNFYVTTSLLCF